MRSVGIGLTILIFIGFVFTGIGYAEIDPETCIGMWLFDRGAGDVASDSSGNGNDGDLIGGPDWVEGKFGKALEFDGVDDRVEVTHYPALDEINDVVTIALWINGGAQVSWPRLLCKNRTEAGAHGFEIQAWPDDLQIGIRIDTSGGDNQGAAQGMTMQVLDEQWHHVVHVIAEGNAKAYMDGEMVRDFAYNHGDGFSSEDNLLIGAAFPAILHFQGTLDEVAIFNAALTKDDINSIMIDGLRVVMGVVAVSPSGKLSTTWGSIKGAYKEESENEAID